MLAKDLNLITLKGNEAEQYFDKLASMRIEVFREYPWLYAGNLEYEREYLNTYLKSKNSLIILLFNTKNNKLIAASTSLPLIEADSSIQKPFIANKEEINDYYYLGETMILPEYRGSGYYSIFMKEREKIAKSLKYKYLCFMTIQRDNKKALMSADYKNPEPIWMHYGYTQLPNIKAEFAWPEIDDPSELQHQLVFWRKEL